MTVRARQSRFDGDDGANAKPARDEHSLAESGTLVLGRRRHRELPNGPNTSRTALQLRLYAMVELDDLPAPGS